jgi:hypothetical protein
MPVYGISLGASNSYIVQIDSKDQIRDFEDFNGRISSIARVGSKMIGYDKKIIGRKGYIYIDKKTLNIAKRILSGLF